MFLLSVTETLKLKSISCKSLWVIGWSYCSISSLLIIRYMNQSCLFPISFFSVFGVLPSQFPGAWKAVWIMTINSLEKITTWNWFQGKDISWGSIKGLQFQIHECLQNAWWPVSSCLGCKIAPFFWCKEIYQSTALCWRHYWSFCAISTMRYVQLDTTGGCRPISWNAFGC